MDINEHIYQLLLPLEQVQVLSTKVPINLIHGVWCTSLQNCTLQRNALLNKSGPINLKFVVSCCIDSYKYSGIC